MRTWPTIRHAQQEIQDQVTDCLYDICRAGGPDDLVDLEALLGDIREEQVPHVSMGLVYSVFDSLALVAAKNGHVAVLERLRTVKRLDITLLLKEAAKSYKREVVAYLIELGRTDHDNGVLLQRGMDALSILDIVCDGRSQHYIRQYMGPQQYLERVKALMKEFALPPKFQAQLATLPPLIDPAPAQTLEAWADIRRALRDYITANDDGRSRLSPEASAVRILERALQHTHA